MPARVDLFGFDATRATLTLRARSRRWRLSRTLRVLAVTALAVPVVGLVPPHAPWVVGALGTGLILARRRWLHRLSVIGLQARCPRCGFELSLPEGVRLRDPHPVPCEGCHHQASLELAEPEPGGGGRR